MKDAGLILLDFDGTVVTFGHDMEYIRQRLVETELAPRGLELPSGYLLEGFELLERRYLEVGADTGQARELKQALLTRLMRLEAEGATHCQLVEGAASALTRLHRRGYRLAIVTRGHTSYVRPLLAHHGLEGLIDTLVTREDPVPFKPHPAGARLAARRLGLDLSELKGCLYLVGDHPMDMQMARAIGALGIGVLTGLSGARELRAAGAAHILKSLAGLPRVIA